MLFLHYKIQSHLVEIFPLRILKGNKIFPQVLSKWMNDSLKAGDFTDPLKLAQKKPVHKKEDPFDKDNYRPTSISSVILINKKSH